MGVSFVKTTVLGWYQRQFLSMLETKLLQLVAVQFTG